MNNRDLYRNTFSRVHASGEITMEDIMNRKKKTPRASRRLVMVFAMVILVLVMGITVNAATGGAIANYFDKLLGVCRTRGISTSLQTIRPPFVIRHF